MVVVLYFASLVGINSFSLMDKDGGIVSRDVPRVLGRLKCSRSEPTAVLPSEHNQAVMKVLQVFSDEVRHRTAQQKHSLSLTVGQKYVLRELRAEYSKLDGEEFDDLRSQIALLEESFKQPLTAAIKKQLNVIRRNGVTSQTLVQLLSTIYHEHGMREHNFQLRHRVERQSEELPRIICSESFV